MFDGIKVKKFELGLQERIDTGLMPSFYTFMSICASAVANLEGEDYQEDEGEIE